MTKLIESNPDGTLVHTENVACGFCTLMLRARFDPRGLQWVNRISGLIIAVFGLIALIIGLSSSIT